MKKALSCLLILALLPALWACNANPSAQPSTALPVETAQPSDAMSPASEEEPEELIVFAAASMTEAMNQIAQMYKAVAPGVTVVFNFDSSGTLKTQIQEGADCDIFISAGQKQMNQLDITADVSVNTEGLDFVLSGSRFNIVGNQVVLIVPQNTQKSISAFEDVMTGAVDLIALGNADVPAGQYAQEVYTNLGLWDALVSSGKVSYGSNVKEVLAQVEAGSVDCGVVYSTDAASSSGVAIAASAPEGSYKAIVYPAAILNTTQNQSAAEAFTAYLQSDACSAVFESLGFSIPQR